MTKIFISSANRRQETGHTPTGVYAENTRISFALSHNSLLRAVFAVFLAPVSALLKAS
jgi:hypothetical protein